jgi:hypothetical protein
MAQLYFHYSNAEGALIVQRGAEVDGLTEAHDRATCFVRSLVFAPNAEDWRDWVLHVSDELGVEIFAVPFASVLGKPH